MEQALPRADFNLSLAYKAARHAARTMVPGHLARWREDVVQEVVMTAVIQHRRGSPMTRTWYRWMAANALRQLFGANMSSRGRREDYVLIADIPEDTAVAHESADRCYARGLSMRRLQEAWPALSARQRAGIFCFVTDPGMTAEVAASLGTSSTVLINARNSTIRAIDDASAVARARAKAARVPLPERPCLSEGCERMAKGMHRRCNGCNMRRSRERRAA